DCSNDTCHCHIGYVHLDYLELDKVFGDGILERIPVM
ncbi:MAG: radical SAM protein, partial [Cyanobacteria bacterium J06643_5]